MLAFTIFFLSCTANNTSKGVKTLINKKGEKHSSSLKLIGMFMMSFIKGRQAETYPIQVDTVSLGGHHSCVLSTNHFIKCWGDNEYGQLGYGDTNDRGGNANEMGDFLPTTDLGSNFMVAQIALGNYHSCALSTNHSIKCWGDNEYGQLGYGDTNNKGDNTNEMGDFLSTVDLGSNFMVAQIALGDYHSCALSTSQSIKCWGRNSEGQLGYGDTNNRGGNANEMGGFLLTVDLGSNFMVAQIALGYYHSCALSTNYSIKCWGSNNSGQLGYEDTNNRGDNTNEMGDYLPTVDLGSNFMVDPIALGAYHSCAVSTNHSIKCWGRNNYGQLGYGDTNNRGTNANEMGDLLPTVNLDNNFIAAQIALGWDYSCALSTNHSIKCWGRNDYGQLGYGDTNNRGTNANEMGDLLPTVNLDSNFIAAQIALGWYHSCALSTNHSIKCWGLSNNGQLGYGDTNNIGDNANEMGGFLSTVDLGARNCTLALNHTISPILSPSLYLIVNFVPSQAYQNYPPEIIEGIPDMEAFVGKEFEYILPVDLIFYDIDSPLLTITSRQQGHYTLPEWMTIDFIDQSSYKLCGIPTDEDIRSYNLIITATDEVGNSVSDDFVLTVNKNESLSKLSESNILIVVVISVSVIISFILLIYGFIKYRKYRNDKNNNLKKVVEQNIEIRKILSLSSNLDIKVNNFNDNQFKETIVGNSDDVNISESLDNMRNDVDIIEGINNIQNNVDVIEEINNIKSTIGLVAKSEIIENPIQNARKDPSVVKWIKDLNLDEGYIEHSELNITTKKITLQ